MPVDVQRLIAGVHDYLGRVVSPLAARVRAIEDRAPTPGLKGNPGDPGRDGKDADPELVRLVVAETLPGMVDKAQAMLIERMDAALAGLKGEPGKDAPPVDEAAIVARVLAQIPTPRDGKDGESVHPDTVRAMVVDQVRAEVANIPRPRDGEDGTDGRDATAIDYRDGIDESKSYPKGTHALYRGGVIVAMRATDPVSDDLTAAGWAVVMNGTHSEAEEILDDGRTIRRMRILTNGKTFTSEHKTAITIYRGVWKHDVEYSRGDLATWDGSVWHCEAGTTKARPGSTPDWKLAVKRGNHGKDGKDASPPPVLRVGK